MKRECKDGWRESVKMDEGDSEKMDEERVKMDEESKDGWGDDG